MYRVNIYKGVKYLNNHGFLNWLSDSFIIKCIFKSELNQKLDLKHPSTFNEKLQWLKLNDRKDIYTKLVDKYEVKKIVSDIIGENHIIPTLEIYDNFDDIDFEKLPNKFVMKCTHDSGGLVIVNDKSRFNKREARKKINKSLRKNYYYGGREWPYKNVKPRIIIEKNMSSNTKDGDVLLDYKFFCFNGKVRCFKIDFNRYSKHQANYYDKNAQLLKFGEVACPPDFNKVLNMPENLNEMIGMAEKLSNNYPFVRVDLYNINQKIYFGELTFYPASGFGKFIPEEWDKKLGDWISLEDLM